MGYTTEFQGEFRCSRRVPSRIQDFLTSIEADPAIIPIFADWLDEQQDERAAGVCGCKTYRAASNVFHALTPEHAAYLRRFSDTRRMKRDPEVARSLPDPVREAVGLSLGEEAEYFVGGTGWAGQDGDDSVRDYNTPPGKQPGLWCHWEPNDDRGTIRWDGGEKFYDYVAWLQYLIERFLGPWGYFLDGTVKWQGEDPSDQGVIRARINVLEAIPKRARRSHRQPR